MPDLSPQAAHQHWKAFNDDTVYRVVSFMESVEDWTIDGDPELEAAMQRLGEELEDIGNLELQNEAMFIKVAAYVRAARMLQLMHVLDGASPGAASKLLMNAEDTTESTEDVPGLFLRRNIVFERLRLLSRVFSPQRIAMVQKALEE